MIIRRALWQERPRELTLVPKARAWAAINVTESPELAEKAALRVTAPR